MKCTSVKIVYDGCYYRLSYLNHSCLFKDLDDLFTYVMLNCFNYLRSSSNSIPVSDYDDSISVLHSCINSNRSKLK